MFFENQLVNYEQAASYLGISISYLRQLKASRRIGFVLVGSRAVRFRVSALDSFVKQREVQFEKPKIQDN